MVASKTENRELLQINSLPREDGGNRGRNFFKSFMVFKAKEVAKG